MELKPSCEDEGKGDWGARHGYGRGTEWKRNSAFKESQRLGNCSLPCSKCCVLQGEGTGYCRIESQRRSWPWRTNESIPKFWIHQQIIKAKGVRNLLCILFLYDFREKVKQSSSIHLANIPHQCFRKSTQPRNLLLSKGLGGDEGKDGKRKRDQANSKKINIFFVSTYKQWFFQFLILSSVFSSENCIYFLYLCLAPVNIMTMHINKAQLFPFFTLPASLNHPR